MNVNMRPVFGDECRGVHDCRAAETVTLEGMGGLLSSCAK